MSDDAIRDSVPPVRRLVRKLLLGDWTPLLRDPLDLMRLWFNDLILGAIGALAGGVLLMVWAYNQWGTERRPGI